MKFFLLLSICFSIAFLMISADENDVKAEIGNTIKGCATKFLIDEDTINKLRSFDEINKLDSTDNIKCFSKCFSEDLGVVNDDGVVGDRILELAVALGQDAEKTKNTIDTCASIFKGVKDCDEAWELYKCGSEHKLLPL